MLRRLPFFLLQHENDDRETFTSNPPQLHSKITWTLFKPCSCWHISPVATCSRARRFGRPLAHSLKRSTQGQSSMLSSHAVTCYSPTAFDCRSCPSDGRSSKKLCRSCWDTDWDIARSSLHTTRDSAHTIADCDRLPAALSVARVSSWLTSLSLVAWDYRPFVPNASWC